MNYSDAGKVIFKWWRDNLTSEKNPEARGNAARLRHARKQIDFLLEPCVHDLAQRLDLKQADKVALLVGSLAHVRQHGRLRLARGLGQGKEPRMSGLRFEKLIRSPNEGLADQVRRALSMVDNSCDVHSLGADLFFWNEKVRNRWCWDYFGTAQKSNAEPENAR